MVMGSSGKKHKKHRKQQHPQSYAPHSPGGLEGRSVGEGPTGGVQMKVVLKLSGSRSKHTGLQQLPSPPPGPAPMELIVSVPRLLLRPVTPTGIEMGGCGDEVRGEKEIAPHTPTEPKHHKVKHKKHRKKHSHEAKLPDLIHGHETHLSTIPHSYPLGLTHVREGHPSNQVTGQHHTYLSKATSEPTSQSGKHFSFSQSQTKKTSPFKFTFSKDVRAESSTITSPSSLPLQPEKKGHKHKKHKHHHHARYSTPSHHSNNSSSQGASEVYSSTVTPAVGVVPTPVFAEGKPSAMFLANERAEEEDKEDKEEEDTEEVMDSTSRLSVRESKDAMNTKPSFHNLSEIRPDAQLHPDAQSHDPASGKPHKKKKKDKKKKHSRHEPAPPSSTSNSFSFPPSSSVPISHLSPPSTNIPFSPPPSSSSNIPFPAPPSSSIPAQSTNNDGSFKPLKRGHVSDLTTEPPSSKRPYSVQPKAKLSSVHGVLEEEHVTTRELGEPVRPLTPPKPTPPSTSVPPVQVKLSSSALNFFLKNIHHLIQKRDPEGIFAEPVTDDIAPGYSAIISTPMDLTTMASKIEGSLYSSVKEFKADFILMCNNAMTYNAPETMYYATAKRLLSSGLQIIAKEISLRPDIRLGKVPSRSSSASPLPSSQPEFSLPPPSTSTLNYSSAFMCRLPLFLIQSRPQPPLPALERRDPDFVSIDIDKLGGGEVMDQSHLTRVVVGCDEDIQDIQHTEDILQQVQEEASSVKENLDASGRKIRCCFLNQNSEGKTMLNILNPDSAQLDSSKPVDLTVLSDHVRMGNNAATVLRTELPMMKATPVSYLMYGPFGSFAPIYDSAFATLSKMDSDLLLSTYGSELGISYAHSLQQFVKGSGGFVNEMANAVLNGLTNNRHSWFADKLRAFEETQKKNVPVKSSNQAPGDNGSGHPTFPSDRVPDNDANEMNGGGASPEGDVAMEMDEYSIGQVEGDAIMEFEGVSSRENSVEGGDKGKKVDSREDTAHESVSRCTTSTPESLDGSRQLDSEQQVHRDMVSTEVDVAGSVLTEVGAEGSVLTGVGVEGSAWTEVSMEGLTSTEVSMEGLASRGVSVEGSTSREVSVEGSGGVSMDAEGLVSASREASMESSTLGEEPRCDLNPPRDDVESLEAGGEQRPYLEESSSLQASTVAVSDVDVRLMRASSLLNELQAQQIKRLSLPSYVSQGHTLLPGPSHQEVGMASAVRQELATLAAKAEPGDVVSVSSLHRAMGLTVEPILPQSLQSSPQQTQPGDVQGPPLTEQGSQTPLTEESVIRQEDFKGDSSLMEASMKQTEGKTVHGADAKQTLP